MTNDVRTATATALSADLVGKIVSGIAESRATTVIAGGKPLLRMLKDSNWVYGQRDEQVQDGAWWAINPLSIGHGWVCWTAHEGATKNALVGESMAPVFEAKPSRPPPAEGGWEYTEQRTFELRCMNGDDEGTEVTYKSSSAGGMRAVDDLLAIVQAHLPQMPSHPCPVVELLTDSYQHAKYGKIYIPIFEVRDWATMDGKLLSETSAPIPEPVKQPEPAPAPTPRRGRPPAAPVNAAPAAPEPTARRRPIRR